MSPEFHNFRNSKLSAHLLSTDQDMLTNYLEGGGHFNHLIIPNWKLNTTPASSKFPGNRHMKCDWSRSEIPIWISNIVHWQKLSNSILMLIQAQIQRLNSHILAANWPSLRKTIASSLIIYIVPMQKNWKLLAAHRQGQFPLTIGISRMLQVYCTLGGKVHIYFISMVCVLTEPYKMRMHE